MQNIFYPHAPSVFEQIITNFFLVDLKLKGKHDV
jgi:hypothetical protein